MANSVEYNVSLLQPESNLIEVRVEFTAPFDNPILVMPVWTPGSYLVRDYSRLVQKMNSEQKVCKISKNEWQIGVKKGESVVCNYSSYAFELTVRTSYFDNRKVFIAPAGLFLYIRDIEGNDTKDWQYNISFELMERWSIFTSLNENDGIYTANDFDELVDSPVCGGRDDVLDIKDYIYTDNGKEIPNKVVLIGDRGDHDIDVFTEKLIKLQNESVRVMGDLPYDRYYWFLYIVGNGGGGLEHKYSNVSIINRFFFTKDEDYDRLLSLEAHEHFHVYNIKRIRPSQLGPFNYTQEVYTRLLWVAEGLTSFYDKISVVRSGLTSYDAYFKRIAALIYDMENTPGRKIYSVEDASFDAWIKLYKSNENTNNSSISYYLKGSVMSICLDLEIRDQTNWEKSLDDFFREMYKDYKQNKSGYLESELQNLMEKYTETDLSDFFAKYIRGTEELPYNKYLNMIGYKLEPEMSDQVWTGLKLNKNMIVKFVYTDSPASKANIYYNDNIISINGYRANKKGLDTILERAKEGDILDILLFRDDILIQTKLTVESPRPSKYKISPLENVTELHSTRQKQMLGPFQ